MSNAELATSYAALILSDDGVEITSDKLQALLKAAKVEVDPIWTTLFSKALDGKDLAGILANIGAGGAAPAAAAAPAGGAAAAEKVEEKKEEPKEESDDDMGFGLFD